MSPNAWILPAIIVAFFVLRSIGRSRPSSAQPPDTFPVVGVQAIDVSGKFNRANTSLLAIIGRWQSGVSYRDFYTSNQNNPQGDK